MRLLLWNLHGTAGTTFVKLNHSPWQNEWLQVVLYVVHGTFQTKISVSGPVEQTRTPKKKQDCNCSPQINTLLFQFSWSNHSPLDKMDGCNKYSETDTLSLRNRILSSAPGKQLQYHMNNGWLQIMLSTNKLSFKKRMPATKEIL